MESSAFQPASQPVPVLYLRSLPLESLSLLRYRTLVRSPELSLFITLFVVREVPTLVALRIPLELDLDLDLEPSLQSCTYWLSYADLHLPLPRSVSIISTIYVYGYGATMTSKASLGQWQSHQRSSSGNVTTQRPPLQRATSHQIAASLSHQGEEIPRASKRDAHGPRQIGSRLKLTISDDAKSPVADSSVKPIVDEISVSRLPLPARGRPWVHLDLPILEESRVPEAHVGSPSETLGRPLPFPVRPGHHSPPTRVDTPGTTAVASSHFTKKDARPKAYVLEVPTTAPRFPPSGKLEPSYCTAVFGADLAQATRTSFHGQAHIQRTNTLSR